MRELDLFIHSIIDEDRNVTDLLVADHTFVNERLALHYGIPNVRGDRFRRVTLTNPSRFGLLGKGGVLMVTSYPNRTAPVLRGAWILERLLGTPPAAPPPDVEAFTENVEGEKARQSESAWKRIGRTRHASRATSSWILSGFALENFDAIGAWRATDRYSGSPIDAAGQLVDGTHVNNPSELRRALTANPEQFVQTLTEKLLMYSLGRDVEYHDMPLVRRIVRDAARDGYRFSAIVKGIVESAPFQQVQIAGSAKARTKGETMFITKKHIPRRTFLRGIGAAVALPLLDSMIPASTVLAQTAASPRLRMGFIYFPHGAIMDQWTPKTTGKDFQISPILQPLEPYKKQLTIVSGLDNKPASLPPVHAIHPGTWLSAFRLARRQEPLTATTIDQLAAQRLGQDTPFPSLEVATESRGGTGPVIATTDAAIRARFRSAIPPLRCRWKTNPRNLFQRLFGQGDTPEDRARLGKQYVSILDVISQESTGLKRRVGAEDRVMLDDYLETIREIERRVQKMEKSDLSKLDLPDAPVGIPNSFDEHLNLMFDLVALAYRANLTRVFSMMMAAEVSNQTYNHVGVSDAFHPLSHHQNDRDEDGPPHQDPDVSQHRLREVPCEAGDHARRRRQRSGSLDHSLRQQHVEQQCA